MPTYKVSKLDIVKFILATTILLMGFLLKAGNIGETDENMFFTDYLSIQDDTREDDTTEEIPSHKSAPLEETNLCANGATICNKIDVIDKINPIIPYTNKIYTVSTFINDNQIIKKKLIESVDTITIRKSNTNKRGFANRNNVTLDIGSVNTIKEFQDLSSHELGHIFDLGTMQGNNSTKDKVFTEFNKPVFAANDPSIYFYKVSRDSEITRKNTAIKKDFCSGYGMSDPFEDFAECFNLYINHNSFFKVIAKGNKSLTRKYNFIATVLKGEYLSKNTQDIIQVKDNKDRRPRDTTKL